MSFLARANALVEACASRGVPIVRILHVDEPATPDNPFSLESGHVRPMQGLADFKPAAEFIIEMIEVGAEQNHRRSQGLNRVTAMSGVGFLGADANDLVRTLVTRRIR